MLFKRNITFFIVLWLGIVDAQQKDDQSFPGISREKLHTFDPLARIKKEIITFNADKSDSEKLFTLEQQKDMFEKYSFALYQLGCASFNPNTQEIKTLWSTIPQKVREHIINTPWCTNTYGQKVYMIYYATPHKNWLELIELFVETGLDVRCVLNTSNDTLLHRLVDINSINLDQDYDMKSIEQLIEKIIQAGANINAQNKVGKTPLHKAYEHQNQDFARFLIELGANKNIKDECNKIPRSYLR